MKLAIYDFDGTYVSKQTLPLMYKLWKEKHLNDKAYKRIWYGVIWRYVLYKLKIFGWTKRKINPYTMRKTADLFRSVPRETLDQFLIDHYNNLQKYIFEPMKKQILQDKANGFHIVLLSGNLDIILKPFKNDGFDTIIGSVSEENGQILPSDKIHILIEDEKKKALIERFKDADYKNSKAYADNGYDIPILELVGDAYAVNPDKELEKHAIKNNWNIVKKDN
ncbi:MAG: haloacid dehalogenase-like hydrolase [Tenericutes bacterium]|jgi:phosphoserine phosphatase|nr:haloacid dehalogenase-like hydrolase [Mycoplasmatota bacterium]